MLHEMVNILFISAEDRDSYGRASVSTENFATEL